MTTAFNDIPLIPKVVNFSITEKCNASCQICATNSNHGRKNFEMNVEEALEWVNQAADIEEIIAICFTGGEPFLRLSIIKQLAKQAFILGLKISVVTNCFWAEEYSNAYSILSQLKDVGLASLTMSADSYHQEFVPIKAVDNAILAAKKLGIRSNLNCVTGQHSNCLDQIIKSLTNSHYLDTVSEINYLPIGRAKVLPPLKRASPDHQRCPLLISTLSIKSDGFVYACCGVGGFTQPLRMGNLKNSSLKQIISRSIKNPLFLFLAIYGPLDLFMAVNYKGTVNDQFCLDKCTICYKMLSNSKHISKINHYLNSRIDDVYCTYEILKKLRTP